MKMDLVDDEEMIKTFFPHRSDPALGIDIRIGGANGREDRLNLLGSKDDVEGVDEELVTIMDQETHGALLILKGPHELTGLLRDPLGLGVCRRPSQMHASGTDLDEKEHIDGLQKMERLGCQHKPHHEPVGGGQNRSGSGKLVIDWAFAFLGSLRTPSQKGYGAGWLSCTLIFSVAL